MCCYYIISLFVIAGIGQVLIKVMDLDFYILNEERVYKGVGEKKKLSKGKNSLLFYLEDTKG